MKGRIRRRLDMIALAILQPILYLVSDEAGDRAYLKFVAKHGVPVLCEGGRCIVRWQPVV